MEPALILAFATNAVSLVAGPVTALLVAFRFSPDVQGYYYTFRSLAALQAVAAFGLGPVVIQFLSHEWAIISDPNRAAAVAAAARQRVGSLVRIAVKWYRLVAISSLVFVLALGWFLLSRQADSGAEWQLPWTALVVLTAIAISLLPFFVVLEGFNRVREFWHYRVVEQAVHNLALWGAILLGAKLWTPAIAVSAALIWTLIFLRRRGWETVRLGRVRGSSTVSWRSAVLPLQWRATITQLSSTFTATLLVPLLFALSGAIEAGRFGMTVALYSVVFGFGSIWYSVRAPRFGLLVAQGHWTELDELFRRTSKAAALSVLATAVGLAAVLWLFYAADHPLTSRLLSPLGIALLVAAAPANVYTFGLATYLRAFKAEPLSFVYAWGALVCLFGGLAVGAASGGTGVAGVFFAASLGFQLPLSLWIHRLTRRRSRTRGEFVSR